MYQNDGTDRGIEPAKFIEAAAQQHNDWNDEIEASLIAWLEENESVLTQTGRQIADDINKAVNRIKTGRLRESMRSVITK